MARGKTLGDVLTSLRVELEVSTNPAHNAQVRDHQVRHLQRVQEQLYDDYSWTHLRVFRYLNAQAGERYYDVTSVFKEQNGSLVAANDISVDRVLEMWVRDGDIWRPLAAGITEEHYNAFNSDTDERDWPPRRWMVTEDNQIEVWPVPGITGDMTAKENIFRFRAVRDLQVFSLDTDVADLDDRLLALMAAAEILGGEKGQKKGALANKRLLKIRGNATKTRRFRMFGDQRPARILRGPPTVYYRTTP